MEVILKFFFEKLLEGIEVKKTDFFENRAYFKILPKTLFTYPIDKFFNFEAGKNSIIEVFDLKMKRLI